MGHLFFKSDFPGALPFCRAFSRLSAIKYKVNYAKGCELSGLDKSGFGDAVKAAQASDAVVVVLGTTSVVFQGIGWNGHAPDSEPKYPFTCGEGYDVTDISPQGV
jgi:beta-glucosidase